MKRVVIDPITRIEGHLRIETVVDEAAGKVQDALSSGTAWRGIEIILKGRDPRDAWAFAQRICGVCTTVHALTSLRSVEDALQIEIPKNANYIRNIMHATQCAHDHVMHFYHLHGFDWVSPVEALKADPEKTATLQNAVLGKYVFQGSAPIEYDHDGHPDDFPKATTLYFREIQNKAKQIVDSGQLGIFAAHWWDHPDYKILPPEVHLLAVAHYLNMLDLQRQMVLSHVVFGGKNPHPHYVVGGMPCSISMHDMNAPINTERLAVVERSLHVALAAVNYFYLPDLLAIGEIYAKQGYFDGGGLAKERVLGYGEYPDEPYSGIANGDFHAKLLWRCNGVVENFAQGAANAIFHDLAGKDFADAQIIQEMVNHSWYTYPDENKGLHPWEGETNDKFTQPKEGTKKNWKYLDEQGKYSWIKTPKWMGKLAEVGPLARYIITYVKVKQGHIQPTWVEKMVVEQIEFVSKLYNLPPEKWMPTTLGRTITRGLDAQVCVYVGKYFFDKLLKNIKAGDTNVANMSKWDPASWPKEVKGIGVSEAPRGALGHWLVIQNSRIANYQAIVPSTWNACPRDEQGKHGAYEASMMDTKIKIADQPLEILKTIRSFDPCLACATHLYDTEGREIIVVRTDTIG